MNKILTTGLGAAFASSFPAIASAQEGLGIDQRINDIFANYTGWYVR